MRLWWSGFGNPDRAGADEKYKGWCAVHTLQGYYKDAVVVVRIWQSGPSGARCPSYRMIG